MRNFVTLVGVGLIVGACSTDEFSRVDDASTKDVTTGIDASVDASVDAASDQAAEATADVAVDAGFFPSSIDGLILWLDSAKRNGNELWIDQANPPHVLAPTNELPGPPMSPSYGAMGGPGNAPVLSFGGTDIVAYSDRADFHPSVDCDVLIAVVIRLTPDVSAQQRLIAGQYQKFGFPNEAFGMVVSSNLLTARSGGALAVWTPSPPTISDSLFHVATLLRTSGGTKLRESVDGVVVTATLPAPDLDASVPARGPFTIGDSIVMSGSAMSYGGGPITGRIAELAMYTAVSPKSLGAAQANQIAAYFKAKYAL